MYKIFILFLFCFNLLWSNYVVEFEGKSSEEIVITTKNNQEYFRVNELHKVFHALINEDMIQQRLFVNIYEEQMIFLLESSYIQFNGEIFNMKYPVLQIEGRYYLPAIFLNHILPRLYPEKISVSGKKIIAEIPVETSLKTIVIDPGHGGKDPGAVGYSKKIYEKNIVLAIAKKLKKMLEDNLDVTVLLTRPDDSFISLQDRTKFANQNQAHLFVSLHCNAHRRSGARGVEVYYLSTAKTDDARAVEALENAVVYEYEGGIDAVKKYDDLSFILADMAQNEHLKESMDFAIRLQQELVTQSQLSDRGVKQANFYVLRGAFMPSILAELGFLSNPEEEKILSNEQFQEKLANALFEGIKNFKMKYDQMQ